MHKTIEIIFSFYRQTVCLICEEDDVIGRENFMP